MQSELDALVVVVVSVNAIGDARFQRLDALNAKLVTMGKPPMKS